MTEFLNLKDAAAFLGVPRGVFRAKANMYGIPPLIVMGRPMYRRKDIDSCLERLWNIREATPQVTQYQLSRSIQDTNALISRLLNGSRQ